MFDIDKDEYGWVLNVPNRKLALSIWGKRWNRLFDKSIEDFNWWDWKLTRAEQRCYMMYAALRWPELLKVNERRPYENEDILPGHMIVLVNDKKPGWEELYKRLEAAIWNWRKKL